jgi:hypothetical protein
VRRSAFVVVDFEANGHWDLMDPQNGSRFILDVFGAGELVTLDGVPSEPGNAFSYDLTGDGVLDVVFVTPDGLVAHQGGMPPLTLTDSIELPRREDTWPHETRPLIGDVDGNGKDDIVLVWATYDEVMLIDVILDSGLVLEEQVIPFKHGGFWDAAIGDVDGDGLDDVILQGEFSEPFARLAVLRNTGEGRFAAPEILDPPDSNGTFLPAVVDLDGDGRAEIVVSPHQFYFEPLVDVWSLEAGGWTHTRYELPPLFPLELADGPPPAHHGTRPAGMPIIADIDADGLPDVIVAAWVDPPVCGTNQSMPGFYALRNDNGALTPVNAFAPRELGYGPAWDIAVRALPNGDIFVYFEQEHLTEAETVNGAFLYDPGSFLPRASRDSAAN